MPACGSDGRPRRTPSHASAARTGTAVIGLVRKVCQDRIAPEYVKLMEQVGAASAMYDAAEMLLLQITPIDAHTSFKHIAPDGGLSRMRLPGARPAESPAIAKVSG